MEETIYTSDVMTEVLNLADMVEKAACDGPGGLTYRRAERVLNLLDEVAEVIRGN